MKRINKEQKIYAFSAHNEPIAAVSQGEAFSVECYDCFTGTMTADDFYSEEKWDSVNPATGPIWVGGTRAGDLLIVEVMDIKIPNQGLMITAPGLGALGNRMERAATRLVEIFDGKAQVTEKVKVPIKPMIGVIGTAPDEGEVLSGTPGLHGANMDCKLITAGSKVYLPVNVEGALFACGDVHAVMADGEICVSGVEVPAEVTLKISSVSPNGWPYPCVETNDSVWILFSAETLDECERGVVDAAANMLVEKGGLTLNDAAFILSSVGDLAICQVVDPLKTMRIRLPKETLNQLDIQLP